MPPKSATKIQATSKVGHLPTKRNKSGIKNPKQNSTGNRPGGRKSGVKEPGQRRSGTAPGPGRSRGAITSGKQLAKSGEGVTEFDSLIKLLTEMEGCRLGREIPLEEDLMLTLCARMVNVLKNQTEVLYLDPPMTIVGSINGYHMQLLRILMQLGYPPSCRYLFLGNYVDRGKFSLECLMLLLAIKIKSPESVYLLLGRHEDPEVNRVYGFYKQCMARNMPKVFEAIKEVYSYMPLAAVIGGKIYCVSSGLCQPRTLEQIEWGAKRPLQYTSEQVRDMTYALPSLDTSGYQWDATEHSHYYGPREVMAFLQENKLAVMVRTGKVKGGYQFLLNRQLITLCSVNKDSVENHGTAALHVSDKSDKGVITLSILSLAADAN